MMHTHSSTSWAAAPSARHPVHRPEGRHVPGPAPSLPGRARAAAARAQVEWALSGRRGDADAK